ncbi:MAG: hypothetical protein KDC71_24290, partial [Acidobacteria bacterium]|nr:hypothetical protein [Acidobacteriota bacterium]
FSLAGQDTVLGRSVVGILGGFCDASPDRVQVDIGVASQNGSSVADRCFSKQRLQSHFCFV